VVGLIRDVIGSRVAKPVRLRRVPRLHYSGRSYQLSPETEHETEPVIDPARDGGVQSPDRLFKIVAVEGQQLRG
jgi:hypothetical protein